MKKKLSIIIAVLLMATVAYAVPGVPGFVGGAVHDADMDNPLVYGCNVSPGEYGIITYAKYGERLNVIVIDYRAGYNPVIIAIGHGEPINLHIGTSTTLIIVAAPIDGEDETTILAFRK